MNKSQLEAYDQAQVMLAFSRGEKVEASSGSDLWHTLNWEPLWNFQHNEYRVAPKPLEVKATVIGENVIAWVHNSPTDANGKQRVVLFREVIE